MTVAVNEKSRARGGARAPGVAQAGGFKLQHPSAADLAAQRKSAEETSRKLAAAARQEPGAIGRQTLALAAHFGRVHRQLSGVSQ
jgi:hypothetical protein